MSKSPLTKHQRRRACDLAIDLRGAFVWQETPQGEAYWRKVYDNLAALGDCGTKPTQYSNSNSEDNFGDT
jgi:hypothetical protein